MPASWTRSSSSARVRAAVKEGLGNNCLSQCEGCQILRSSEEKERRRLTSEVHSFPVSIRLGCDLCRGWDVEEMVDEDPAAGLLPVRAERGCGIRTLRVRDDKRCERRVVLG